MKDNKVFPIYHDIDGETMIDEITETSISSDRGLCITVTFRSMTLEEEKECRDYKASFIQEIVKESLPERLANGVNEELRKRLDL